MLELSTTRESAQDRLSVLVYGSPSVGKTHLANTLPIGDDSQVLYIKAEQGTLALKDRDFQCYDVRDLNDIVNLRENVARACHDNGIKWIVVDTIGRIGDIMVDGFKETTKDKFAVWDKVGAECRAFISALTWISGVSTLFLGHESADHVENRFSIVPYFPGKVGSKFILDEFDMIGHMRFDYVTMKDGSSQQQRVIQFDPMLNTMIATKDRSGVMKGYTYPSISHIQRQVQATGATI